MDTSPAVARVIESCLDDERTLVQESKVVDERRRAVLMRLADERRRFAEDLERFNGQGSRESWGGIAREAGNKLWAEMAGRNPGDAVAACLRSQHRTEVRYEEALETELSSDVRAALVTQHQSVQAARADLAKIEF